MLRRAHGNNVVLINLASVLVGGRGDHFFRSTRTGFCLHVWRGERKGGRDYGTSHQGELQVLSHSRVFHFQLEDTTVPTQLPARNLTENPATRVGRL